MATISKTKAAHATLSTTVADRVNLTQFWDSIEISNQGTVPMYVTWDGTTAAVSAADNTDIVEAGVTKAFPGYTPGNGVPGSTSTPCHSLSIVGNANPYGVIGLSGQ